MIEYLNSLPPPPTILLWATILGVIFQICWAILSAIIGLIRSRMEKARRVIDDFWYRQLIMPWCIRPLMEFIETATEKIRKKEGISKKKWFDTYASMQDWFLEQVRQIRNRFFLLRAVDQQHYDLALKRFEELEDHMIEYCAKRGLGDEFEASHELADDTDFISMAFWACLRDVTADFIELHKKNL